MQKQIQNQPRLGLEVMQGCNLAELTEEQRRELKKSLWNHGVIVVKQQNLTASQLEEFARQTFGNLMFGNNKILDPDISPNLQSQYVYILGNPKGETEPTEKFAWKWHQDKDGLPRSELEMNALYVVILYGVEVPPFDLDGQPHTTQFIDLIEAYNNLDYQQQQQLENISLYHRAPAYSKEATDVPTKVHPIVSVHKVTRKKGLYLGVESTIPVGMENNSEEVKLFWQNLFENILKRTPVYSHVWQKGDIVLWDNSQVMHKGIPYDATKYKRIALRLGVVDTEF